MTTDGVRYFLIGLLKQGSTVNSWVFKVMMDDQEALEAFEKHAETLLAEKPLWHGFRLEKDDKNCWPYFRGTIREEWAPHFKTV